MTVLIGKLRMQELGAIQATVCPFCSDTGRVSAFAYNKQENCNYTMSNCSWPCYFGFYIVLEKIYNQKDGMPPHLNGGCIYGT